MATWTEWWTGKRSEPMEPDHAAADHEFRLYFTRMLDGPDSPVWFKASEIAQTIKVEDLRRLGYDTWEEAVPAVKALAFDMRALDYCEISKNGRIVPDDVEAYEVEGGVRIRRKRTAS